MREQSIRGYIADLEHDQARQVDAAERSRQQEELDDRTRRHMQPAAEAIIRMYGRETADVLQGRRVRARYQSTGRTALGLWIVTCSEVTSKVGDTLPGWHGTIRATFNTGYAGIALSVDGELHSYTHPGKTEEKNYEYVGEFPKEGSVPVDPRTKILTYLDDKGLATADQLAPITDINPGISDPTAQPAAKSWNYALRTMAAQELGLRP